MLVSEANGIPVAFLLEAANTHESQLARDVLAKVRVPRLGKGRPKTRILAVAMDRAFDAVSLRRDLRQRGMKASIPERRRRGKRRQRGPHPKLYEVSKRRYKVERLNAWMDNFRALVVRYERKTAHYLGYCTLAAILFCLKRLLP
jgi:transposase